MTRPRPPVETELPAVDTGMAEAGIAIVLAHEDTDPAPPCSPTRDIAAWRPRAARRALPRRIGSAPAPSTITVLCTAVERKRLRQPAPACTDSSRNPRSGPDRPRGVRSSEIRCVCGSRSRASRPARMR